MTRFRKKPIVIEAVQFTGPESMEDIFLLVPDDRTIRFDDEILTIETLEGNMRANDGDWIIKGVKGEIYPCKPDIFDATYESVEDEEDTNPNDVRYN